MKKSFKVLTVLFAAAGMLSLAGCDFFSALLGDGIEDEKSTKATKEETWEYSASDPIFKIGSDVKSVTVSNIPADKTIYLVKRNTSDDTIIEGGNTRKLESTSRAAADVEESVTEPVKVSAEDLPTVRRYFEGEKLPGVKEIKAKNGKSRSVFDADGLKPSLDTTSSTSVVQDYVVGSGTKKIYVDTNYDMDNYQQKPATLRAKIENLCYVWVVEDYYDNTASGTGKNVNMATATTIAQKFNEMYPLITAVFGTESNKMIDSSSTSSDPRVDISSVSDTGEMINIVIYDIGADYGKDEQTGVMGYFYAKDYFTPEGADSDSIISKSNKGKYFYIDSYYANKYQGETISTLAHEFQHMINYGVKVIDKELEPSSAYNEMLSMLCEDMMQEYLGLDDWNSPKGRLLTFNAFYWVSGITEWLGGNYSIYSYNTSYSFGAWLCRQYGGAALVKEMMQNDYVNNESIVKAVNTLNSTSFTFEDIFEQYLLSLTGSTVYTANQNADERLSESYTSSSGAETYTYPMKAYDLWSTDCTEYDSDGDGKNDSAYFFNLGNTKLKTSYKNLAYDSYTWTGPFVFNSKYDPSLTDLLFGYSLMPENGISIHGIEESKSGTETFTFSSTGSEDLVMYLIIQ